jgi:molybdopterin molybdotransferase
MIPIEDALRIVKQHTQVLSTEKISYKNSLGRILAEDVQSDIDMPPFDKSAVDGYACKKEDIDSELKIVEVVQAGQTPLKEIQKGECTQIMTGAPVPKGSDTIVMVEHVSVKDEIVSVVEKGKKDNISFKAEDVNVGQTVLQKNIRIKPQHIAIFSSVGYTDVLVYEKVKVAVISTGDELVEPDEKPGVSKIRNSNGHQLVAQIEQMGAIAKNYGIAKDTEEDTFDIVTKALSENDVVLLSGGVSMGEFDFVPGVLMKAGIEILFDSLAVKPGKPTTFGIAERKRCFGLPGNPVSSFIQFELLVKPLLYGMMGMINMEKDISMPMAEDYCRKRASRKAYMPITVENGLVKPIEYHGSAHIHALSFADGIISIPIGVACLKKGEMVDVRQI